MSLYGYIDKRVCVMTTEGRTIVGTLISCDQLTNLALVDAIERVIRPHDDPEPSGDSPIEGVQLIRGDSVVLCGLIEEDIEREINWEKVRGEVIGTTKHV